MEITENELIEALRQAEQYQNDNPHRAKTTQELLRITGKTEKWVHTKLRLLKNEGKLGIVRIIGEALDGRMIQVPAYYLKDDDKCANCPSQ